jgi:pimeloyl-ACP methyl ester carboxylesterase
MALANVNGVQLFYQSSGGGPIPLVLTHGSWGSHSDWDAVVPQLADSFRITVYDRRGHSKSERIDRQGSITEDVADLAALIEHLELSPAWVAGHSYGASIVLRLAGERPDLLRGIIAHEAPLLSLLNGAPDMAPMLGAISEKVGAVVKRIDEGEHAAAAEQFFEEVAMGAGAWSHLPATARQTFIYNAPTFLDEARDPEQLNFDLAWIQDFQRPCLLTTGEQSPPFHEPINDQLVSALPEAEVVTIPGAGHMAHVTHPVAYAHAVTEFIAAI